MFNDYVLLGETEDNDIIIDYEKCNGWEDRSDFYSRLAGWLTGRDVDRKEK